MFLNQSQKVCGTNSVSLLSVFQTAPLQHLYLLTDLQILIAHVLMSIVFSYLPHFFSSILISCALQACLH